MKLPAAREDGWITCRRRKGAREVGTVEWEIQDYFPFFPPGPGLVGRIEGSALSQVGLGQAGQG